MPFIQMKVELGPRLGPTVKKRAKRIKMENPKWGATRIRRMLKEEFPTVSLRSERQIYRWIKYVPAVTDQDKPWTFSHSERGDIPWEASPLLLKLALTYGNRLTNRAAKWCWRVRIAAPKLSAEDIFDLGQEYGDREWTGSILDIEPHFVDLDGLLKYQPWNSQEALLQYLQAVKRGAIPGDLGPGAFKDDKEEEDFRMAQKRWDLPNLLSIWIWEFAHLDASLELERKE